MENNIHQRAIDNETSAKSKLKLAGFWDRYAALILDSLILSPVTMGLIAIQVTKVYSRLRGANWGLLFANPELFEFRYGNLIENSTNTVATFIQIAAWLYFVYFTHQNQATPGKALLKLRVAGKKQEKLPLLRALLRETIGKVVSGILFPLGYVWMVWDKDKQAWHDKIAHSYVYRTGDNRKMKSAIIGVQLLLIIGVGVSIFWTSTAIILKYQSENHQVTNPEIFQELSPELEDLLEEIAPQETPLEDAVPQGNIT